MRIDKIPEDAVLIEGTVDDYVDPRGNVYGYNHRNNQPVYPYRKETQEVFGYLYVPINYKSGRKSRRVHRVVADAFVPNPKKLPVVMHKDNNKKNNRVENLEWGTVSKNTKQAFDDGLVRNDSGIEDSQSVPCCMYDTSTNKLLASFGSIKEAAQKTGLVASTIARQVKNVTMPIRKSVYFTAANEGARAHFVVAKFNSVNDKMIAVYPNCSKAALANEISEKVVAKQCRNEEKPRWTKADFYFKRIYLKCEEVIEIHSESRVGNV